MHISVPLEYGGTDFYVLNNNYKGNRQMKRLALLLLTVTLIFGLTACTGGGQQVSGVPPEERARRRIKMPRHLRRMKSKGSFCTYSLTAEALRKTVIPTAT